MVQSVISDTKKEIEKLKSDQTWQGVKTKIYELAESNDIEIEMLTCERTKKRKRFMDELSVDESPTDHFE